MRFIRHHLKGITTQSRDTLKHTERGCRCGGQRGGCIPALAGIKLSRVIGSIDRINWSGAGGGGRIVVKVSTPSAVAASLSLLSTPPSEEGPIADEAKPIGNKEIKK